MSLIEELTAKWPRQHVPPYGECLVVPGREFNPDWEAMLDDLGYGCVFTDVAGRIVTLVKLEREKREEREEGEEVEEKQKKPRKMGRPPTWTPDLDKKLIEMANRRPQLMTKEIQVQGFPQLTESSVNQRIWILQKAGKIGSRQIQRPKKHRKTSKPPAEEKSSTPTHAPTSALKDAPTSPPIVAPKAKDPVVGLLEEIRDRLSHEDSVTFDYYCPKCRELGYAESQNTWQFCPLCGGPLIVWNVEANQ